MANNNNNNPHFLLFTPHHHHHDLDHDHDLELEESDIIWSSTTTTIHQDDTTTIATASAAVSPRFVRSPPSAGLTVALQYSSRKTNTPTSSSPLSRTSSSDIPGAHLHAPPPTLTSYYSKKFPESAPVNIPVWPTKFGGSTRRVTGPLGSFVDDEEEEDGGGVYSMGEMVPPHEIVARSHKTMTFSVIEGAGRTLKGRDLTRVRNAVFHKTGFLD